MKTLRYIPTSELVMFFAICILIVGLYLVTGFHYAILILAIFFAYVFVLGGANFIRIKDQKICITYCYILVWTDVVELKDVLKIESLQTFQNESIDPETIFYEFRTSYQLEFRDKKNRIKKLHFRIVNKRKESEIVTEITNALQSKR